MNDLKQINLTMSRMTAAKTAEKDRVTLLLQIEAEARDQATEAELRYHIANVTRDVLPFRQAFVLRRRGRQFRLEAVSSIATVERNAPMTSWIERIVGRLQKEDRIAEQALFEIDGYSDKIDPEFESYPFHYFMWTPLKTAKEKVFAGFLVAKEVPWSDGERRIAARISDTYSHAWRALVGERRVVKSALRPGRLLSALLISALFAAGFIRVPLTAIAPMEVVAANSTVIAAGIEGVIEQIIVDANADVAVGDVLVKYEQDEIQNAYHLAERRVAVAEAKALRAQQAAVASTEAKAELSIAAAELSLAIVERQHALTRTQKLVVKSPVAGVAVFSDKRDWAGRPVRIGERIMEVAEPGSVLFRIELAVDDAIVLKNGARVRVFLDSDPLKPVEARLAYGAYRAEPVENGRLAYLLQAKPIDGELLPRIGTRGSAQVYGDEVSLALFLFRRPISAVRQYMGL